MERIGNMIRDGIKPDLTAYTAIEKVMEGGKALIHVTVSRGLKRPYHLIDKGLKPSGVLYGTEFPPSRPRMRPSAR